MSAIAGMGAAIDWERKELEDLAAGSAEHRRVCDQVDSWTAELFRAGQDLVRTEAMAELALGPGALPLNPNLIDDILSHPLFGRWLHVRLAEKGLQATEAAPTRFRELLLHLVGADLNPFARRYLARCPAIFVGF